MLLKSSLANVPDWLAITVFVVSFGIYAFATIRRWIHKRTHRDVLESAGRVPRADLAGFEIDAPIAPVSAVECVEALVAGDLTTARARLANASLDEQAWITEELARVMSPLPVLAAWVDAEPDNPNARVLHATNQTAVAWAIRGHGTIDTVSREDREGFAEWLRGADENIAHALRVSPNNPIAYERAIVVAKGLSRPKSEIVRLHRKAMALAPGLLGPAEAAITSLAPKWSGTERQMLQVARAATADAPEGSPAAGAYAIAALLIWEFYANFCEDLTTATRIVQSPANRLELRDCASRWLAGRKHPDQPGDVAVANTIAFLAWLGLDHELARQTHDAIDGRYLSYPWVLHPNGEVIQCIALSRRAAATDTRAGSARR